MLKTTMLHLDKSDGAYGCLINIKQSNLKRIPNEVAHIPFSFNKTRHVLIGFTQ